MSESRRPRVPDLAAWAALAWVFYLPFLGYTRYVSYGLALGGIAVPLILTGLAVAQKARRPITESRAKPGPYARLALGAEGCLMAVLVGMYALADYYQLPILIPLWITVLCAVLLAGSLGVLAYYGWMVLGDRERYILNPAVTAVLALAGSAALLSNLLQVVERFSHF